MHELGIAENILQIVQQAAPENQAMNVRLIRVRVGRLSGVVPDSLEFCFSAIVNQTELEQARLMIEQVPIVYRCQGCAHQFQMDDFSFFCPECQGNRLELISGRELEVVDIELADRGDGV